MGKDSVYFGDFVKLPTSLMTSTLLVEQPVFDMLYNRQ